ncbi:MAG: RAMP superfamily CRISPR-associated protein [Candidatus Helarchaeota archaeon]
MKILKFVLLSKAITCRQDVFVNFKRSRGIDDQKNMSPIIKYAGIPPTSIRGLLRHATEKKLALHGIGSCHPLPSNTVVIERNREYYDNDFMNNPCYHPRGDCIDIYGEACPVLDLFGTLDRPGKIMTPPIFFYPAGTGGASAKNISKIFGGIGTGRVEIIRNSPRCRENTHRVYLTGETVAFTLINAPFNIILPDSNEDYEILIYKMLEFLVEQNLMFNKNFYLGGMRGFGFGRVAIVRVDDKGEYKTKGRNILGIPNDEAREIDEKWEKIIAEWKKKFPPEKYNYEPTSKKVKKEVKKRKKNGE